MATSPTWIAATDTEPRGRAIRGCERGPVLGGSRRGKYEEGWGGEAKGDRPGQFGKSHGKLHRVECVAPSREFRSRKDVRGA